MSRVIHWNDEYCPNGHKWTFCAASGLYPDFYYCEAEDKFWEPTVRPIKPEKVAKAYHSHRLDEMRKYAQREHALEETRYISFDKLLAFVQENRETPHE